MKKNYIYAIVIIALVIILGVLIYFFVRGENTDNNIYDSSSAEITKNNNSETEINSSNNSSSTTAVKVSGKIYSSSDVFTDRDLKQTADLTDAKYYTLTSNDDIHITSEGVYVISGTASNATIYVEAGDEDKVQLVLDGINITNDNFPCIYVKSADKVFITTNEYTSSSVSTENSLTVTGTFVEDGDVNTDGVIFSKSDIILNGTGTLTISSTDNGIVGKDDVKITGGTYNITATSKTIEANDSICISDGTFNLKAGTDGLHAENSDDNSLGYIFITGGTININAGDDGIHGTSVVQIDDGTINNIAAEGIEGTYIQINGGTIKISATDDGINAGKKSTAYSATVEINDGDITINMGSGDTDGIDSNGDIIVNGGTINVNGTSTFDYDGNAEFNGGTIIVNGSEVNAIPNQLMGGGQGGKMMQGGRGQH